MIQFIDWAAVAESNKNGKRSYTDKTKYREKD